MNESQASPNNLLDTTDCLEAVGVFKGWKNFLFVIVLLCLLVLQASFLLVDTGCITVEDQAGGTEPAVMSSPAGVDSETAEPAIEKVQKLIERMKESEVEANKTVEAVKPVETTKPEEVAEPNETAEPNQPAETISKAAEHKLQRAITWPPTEFFSCMTFEYLSWIIRIANAVLILTASLYCLSMLFSLKVSMLGRLGGINHISRAFFLSLLMLILLLPWQRIFGGMVPGAIFTPDELVQWSSAEAGDVFDTVIYYLRFSGYWLLVLLLLILSQIRSIRWGKAILRRLEII
jgi:hypothetical protein